MQEIEADRSSVSVSIQDALDSYLRLKGAGRSKTFFQGAERAVGYLTEATDAEELSSLSAADAARFRNHLIGKGMTAASVRRVFGTVKAITNLAIREYGLACPNVFANVFIPDDEKASTRLPMPDDNHVAIQKECVELDDDVRWLVALISDTGMRLAETAGLLVSDIKLDAGVPHITLRKHPWRSLKTREVSATSHWLACHCGQRGALSKVSRTSPSHDTQMVRAATPTLPARLSISG